MTASSRWHTVLTVVAADICLLLGGEVALANLQLYAITTDSVPEVANLYSVDASTGASSFVTELHGTGAPLIKGIDFRDNGQLYAISAFGNLMTVDAVDGTVSFVGTRGGDGTPGRLLPTARYWDVAFGPSDDLYVVGMDIGNFSSLMKLDVDTGIVDSMVAVTEEGPNGQTYHPSVSTMDFTFGGVLYAGGMGLYTIDVTTGDAMLNSPRCVYRIRKGIKEE